MALRSASQFHNDWGIVGEPRLLPNAPGDPLGAGAHGRLEIGDTATVSVAGLVKRWYCVDPGSPGALPPAAWYEVSPSFVGLGPMPSGDRYDTLTNAFPGVATGFIVAGLIEMRALLVGTGQTFLSNIDFGIDGWQMNVEGSGVLTPQIVLVDGSILGAPSGPNAPLSDPIASHSAAKHYLMLLRVYVDGGGDTVLEQWTNGQMIHRETSSVAYAPRTAPPQIGRGAFGNTASETLLGGLAYFEGTVTDEDIREHWFESLEAGDLVAGPISWGARYSAKQTRPGASWAPLAGAGPTFTRVGSPALVARPAAHFG